MNTPRIRLSRALGARLLRATPALALLLAASACEDPFALTATRQNVNVSLEAWALSGTSPTLPSALLVPVSTMSRLDAAGSFDLAFDIDGGGNVVVLPVGSVVVALAGTRPVAFQRPALAYDAILEAPRNGWTSDSALVLGVGDLFLVRVPTQFCQFDFRQEIYAKYRVDSIFPAERRLRISGRVNPNCGFRSFQDGIPEF